MSSISYIPLDIQIFMKPISSRSTVSFYGNRRGKTADAAAAVNIIRSPHLEVVYLLQGESVGDV